MLPDRVSNPEPLTYESGVLPIALRGPAEDDEGRTSLTKASENGNRDTVELFVQNGADFNKKR